jgi:hypothetical protein
LFLAELLQQQQLLLLLLETAVPYESGVMEMLLPCCLCCPCQQCSHATAGRCNGSKLAAAKLQLAPHAFTSGSFIDDGFFSWEHDESLLIAFLQMLNPLLPNIRLTYISLYSQAGIDYMHGSHHHQVYGCADVPADVRLKITTYQKPHHQYIYITVFTGVEFSKASSSGWVTALCCHQHLACRFSAHEVLVFAALAR